MGFELEKNLEGFGKAGSLIIRLLNAKLSSEQGWLVNHDHTIGVFPRQTLNEKLKEIYPLNEQSYVYSKELIMEALKLLRGTVKFCEPNKEGPLLLYDDELMIFIAPRIEEMEEFDVEESGK